MNISRWAKQYAIIDYTPGSEAETEFVRRWIFDHRDLLHNVQVNEKTFTFKAINSVIGDFERDLDMFKEEDLQEIVPGIFSNEITPVCSP